MSAQDPTPPGPWSRPPVMGAPQSVERRLDRIEHQQQQIIGILETLTTSIDRAAVALDFMGGALKTLRDTQAELVRALAAEQDDADPSFTLDGERVPPDRKQGESLDRPGPVVRQPGRSL